MQATVAPRFGSASTSRRHFGHRSRPKSADPSGCGQFTDDRMLIGLISLSGPPTYGKAVDSLETLVQLDFELNPFKPCLFVIIHLFPPLRMIHIMKSAAYSWLTP